MAQATRYVADEYGPDFIDINFGCPVKKVVKRNGGSGCLRDLDLVERIIRAVDDATALPTTVKIRSGYDEATRNPVEIGLRCQDAGARLITLHARTRTDMYSGHARWDEIAAVVEALDIPVVGNGDIHTGADARRMAIRVLSLSVGSHRHFTVRSSSLGSILLILAYTGGCSSLKCSLYLVVAFTQDSSKLGLARG